MICCEKKTYKVGDMKKIKIVHVLASGKRVKSIEGHVVPASNPVYEIVLQAHKGEQKCKKLVG